MPKLIRQGRIILRQPPPGGKLTVQAEWPVDRSLLDKLNVDTIRQLFDSVRPLIKVEMSAATSRAYTISGLQQRTGRLLQAAANDFEVTVNLQVFKDEALVEVIISWFPPTLAYFFAQLHGRAEINLKAHAFLIFSERTKDNIQGFLNSVIDTLLSEADVVSRRTKVQIDRVSLFRPSKFRIRRTLRKMGVSAVNAANFTEITLAQGNTPARVLKEIQNPELVKKIKKGILVQFEKE